MLKSRATPNSANGAEAKRDTRGMRILTERGHRLAHQQQHSVLLCVIRIGNVCDTIVPAFL